MLLDSLHIAAKSLNASSIGTQVSGQNLYNAGTPGYVREQVLLGTAYPKKTGSGLALGTGVDVNGVVQMIDLYLEERLRNSQSDAMSSTTQSGVYSQLEFILNELTDKDLSTQLDDFFNSIGNVLNQPENLSIRKMVVDEGVKLARQIADMSNAILKQRVDINRSIADLAGQINLLTKEIENLNNAIAQIEAGRAPGIEAVGLRDQRLVALSNLASLVNIKTHEDENGVMTVYCGNDLLISSGGARELSVFYTSDPYGDLSLAEIRFASDNSPLDVRSGKLYGFYEGRDTILGGFSKQLDDYAASLILQFNAVYAGGQGLTGYDAITSLASVTEIDVPLDRAGLVPPPQNGVFSIQVQNKRTGVSSTTEILVPLTGSGQEKMTLQDLVTEINKIEGITAGITIDNKLEIVSNSPELQFAFADDTAGILSSLGLNTFFTGNDARTIGVNQTLRNDPGKFAVSRTGIGADTENGVRLAAMPEERLGEYGNKSVTEAYRFSVTDIMSRAGILKAVSTGDISYYMSLQTQRDAISGVNIDEETIMLMNFQRIYQASAKYVTIVNEMLDALIRM
ncbi:MAG: flagellar hook-associated protein FlgK [Planctomycetaceae bacterium]|nr:flagellar hook-associated protein FlgK [Planctomycetaceae bacterium]